MDHSSCYIAGKFPSNRKIRYVWDTTLVGETSYELREILERKEFSVSIYVERENEKPTGKRACEFVPQLMMCSFRWWYEKANINSNFIQCLDSFLMMKKKQINEINKWESAM